jgi:allantoicase
MNSEQYQQAFIDIDSNPEYANLNDGQKFELAKEHVSDQASRATMTDARNVAASVAATMMGDVPLANAMLKGFKGSAGGLRGALGGAATGVVREAPMEAIQEGTQQRVSNEISNEYAGTNIDPNQGVAEAAVGGGLMGAAMGGSMGTVGGLRSATQPAPEAAPESVSVEACVSEVEPSAKTVWHTVLTQTAVEAHSQNIFEISNDTAWTHIRLNMFPDGGVARIRVYGEADVNWEHFVPGELIDLAYIKNGGKALLASDMFFSDKNNLIRPGRGVNMGDGWETKRRRDPGPDWLIAKLAAQGSIEKVLIDTCHFKGNFPDTFSLEGMISSSDDFTNGQQDANWQPIIDRTKLAAHREHLFINELLVKSEQTFTHVRINIFPDGGISRMRLFGKRKD